MLTIKSKRNNINFSNILMSTLIPFIVKSELIYFLRTMYEETLEIEEDGRFYKALGPYRVSRSYYFGG